MAQIKVTFFKEVHGYRLDDVQLVKVEFNHSFIGESTYDNFAAAFDKAVQLGADPTKEVRFKLEGID